MSLLLEKIKNIDWNAEYRNAASAWAADKNKPQLINELQIFREALNPSSRTEAERLVLHKMAIKNHLTPEEIVELKAFQAQSEPLETFAKSMRPQTLPKTKSFFDTFENLEEAQETGKISSANVRHADQPNATPSVPAPEEELIKATESNITPASTTPAEVKLPKEPRLKGFREALPRWMPGSLKEAPIKATTAEANVATKKWKMSDLVPDFFKKKSPVFSAEEKRFFSAEENLLDKYGETALIGAGVLAAGGWAMHELNKRHAAAAQNTDIIKF